ncbi:MAG: hypothetical protein LWX83_06745 [Anaerolineae bacterium]|nr:hypothetical protein [Anaerolineae bacterium]
MLKKMNIGASILIALALILGVMAPAFAQTQTPPAGNGNNPPQQPGGDPWLSQVAEALSLDVKDLESALQSGSTIETLAEKQNVDLDSLIETLLKTTTERLAQEVTDGKLTQAEADAQVAEIKSALEEWFTTGTRPDSLSFEQPLSEELRLVAEVLGLSDSELQKALDDGKTLTDLLKTQGISLDELISAVSEKRSEQTAQMVTDGKLTQTDLDKMLEDLKTNLTEWYDSGKIPEALMQRGGGVRVGYTEVAEALGMTVEDLTSALKAGTTISQLVQKQGITLDTLVTTLLQPFSEQLDKSVSDGKMTQAQADQKLADMKTDLTTRLENNQLDAGGPGGDKPAGGPGGQGGNAPAGPAGGAPNGGGPAASGSNS